MELWIRNQDRENLVKVELLEIQEREEDYIICTMFQNKIAHLGIYATKERALEVLDEIQKLLQPQTIINYENKLEFHPEYTIQNVAKTIPKTEIRELTTYVYEMPKD